MNSTTWAVTDDIGRWATTVAFALFAAALLALIYELRLPGRHRWAVFSTGALAAACVTLAALRPVTVRAQANRVGPRVAVLVDQSRRMLMPSGRSTRLAAAEGALQRLSERFENSRLTVLGFGEGSLQPLPTDGSQPIAPRGSQSDLESALRELASSGGESPMAVVVVSDGRLSRPLEALDADALRTALGDPRVPIHTVDAAGESPADASIRVVHAAGVAVAHQPLPVVVEVGCAGGLSCERLPVRIRELRDGVPPAELASGYAKVEAGIGKVELEVTLDRAGDRVLEVSLEAPPGDEIPENDTRHLTFSVTRDRIRLLHLAGRPTYDVRALRRWLASDESVDVVAFFILRDSHGDDPGASSSELALIHFPVDELFLKHLSSFDAVILQDIDAVRYQLTQYLPRLSDYVGEGGGLIMVGGPSSFAGGNYAGTALDRILPVEKSEEGAAFDAKAFVPRYTVAGHAAAITQPLRDLLGDSLPQMVGTNFLGPAREDTIVLWEHPVLQAGGQAMPVLALGEAGDGRSIALGVDATHRLAFGPIAAAVAGRAYGALWDGLLGWLMRDPRYEAARVELVGECIEGASPTVLRLTRLPGMTGEISLSLLPLGDSRAAPVSLEIPADSVDPVEVRVPGLRAGGYTARARVGDAPPSRHDFACERGGQAWVDSRPDPERLRDISRATGGQFVGVAQIGDLPEPDATSVSARRQVSPVAPPWAWTLASALLLGAHWVTRRNEGLA